MHYFISVFKTTYIRPDFFLLIYRIFRVGGGGGGGGYGGQVIFRVFFCFQSFFLFIPRHTLVSGYYVIPFGVCPSVLTISDR